MLSQYNISNIIRKHSNSAHCRVLMRRFYERSLLYDPHEAARPSASRRLLFNYTAPYG